jgi:RNA polymerase sigma-70 factor (ECF subfamily)
MTAGALPRSLWPVTEGAAGDAQLLARLAVGDQYALAAVYDTHADLVYGLARRVTRDEQLARDITQEVFAYLWEFPGRVDLARGSIRAYLAVVTHRRAVDEVRRSERRARTEASLAAPMAQDGPEGDVVEAAAARWRRDRLAAGMAALPSEQRTAVELAYYNGLTYKEVARALNIPEGTAKSRLRLAMSRLRAVLGEEMRTAIGGGA